MGEGRMIRAGFNETDSRARKVIEHPQGKDAAGAEIVMGGVYRSVRSGKRVRVLSWLQRPFGPHQHRSLVWVVVCQPLIWKRGAWQSYMETIERRPESLVRDDSPGS